MVLTDSQESGVKKEPTTQLEIKTILNRIQRLVGFVYSSIRLCGSGGSLRIEARIRAHRGIWLTSRCSLAMLDSDEFD